MSDAAPARALLLGSISRDLLREPDGRERAQPGGTVHHAGLALLRLGARVRVVTRLRTQEAAELLEPLRAEGAEVLALPSPTTTCYRNDYRGETDRHELLETSLPIGPDDVPDAWSAAELVQLGPLHPADIDGGVVERLQGLKGLDLQGFLRGPGAARSAALREMIPHIDVVQASESELAGAVPEVSPEVFLRELGVAEMLLTRGSRGATVLTATSAQPIRTRSLSAGDRAGAGDVFLATYLLSRAHGQLPVPAAEAAVRACVAKIEYGTIPLGFRLEGSGG